MDKHLAIQLAEQYKTHWEAAEVLQDLLLENNWWDSRLIYLSHVTSKVEWYRRLDAYSKRRNGETGWVTTLGAIEFIDNFIALLMFGDWQRAPWNCTRWVMVKGKLRSVGYWSEVEWVITDNGFSCLVEVERDT